jgi:uncharacterized protein (DUF1800 family)
MAWLCALACGGVQAGGDEIFGGHTAGFEAKYFVPASDAEAARFLTQATFGPSRTSIAQFRASTYDGWINAQMAQPTTSARAYLDFLAGQATPPSISQSQRVDRWFHTAAFGPDQLRQRMAFALSQILVVSDRADALSGDHFGVAEYWDILARNAFGNYRQLLEEVTLSPMMGRYLSHWRNRKANITGTQLPDENYAREIMQLFTVGLVERADDFSPILDGLGQPIPTYVQQDVSELARVFTGWSYDCAGSPVCNTYTGINSGPAGYTPMACFPAYTDTGSKTIIGGVTVAAGPVCGTGSNGTSQPSDPNVVAACRVYCVDQIEAVLDYLFNHPNVAPFVSRQLIQRFVTSNPSGAYIARVAAVFNDNGQGVRGDLAAVLRAVLLDDEARVPPTDPASPYGKVREPLLRLTATWRAFGVTAPVPTGGGEVNMGIQSPQNNFAQRPLGAPTVFNFYEPDFQPPGALADAGLYAPELQIANETTAMTSANELWTRAWRGYNTSSGSFTAPTDSAYLSFAELVPLVSGANSTGPNAYNLFLDELNIRLFYGTMSTPTRDVLKNFMVFSLAGQNDNIKVLSAVHLALMSPEFIVQR